MAVALAKRSDLCCASGVLSACSAAGGARDGAHRLPPLSWQREVPRMAPSV